MLSIGPPALVITSIADRGYRPDGVVQAKGQRGKTQAFRDMEDREIVEDKVIQQLRQGAWPQLEGTLWAQKRLKVQQLRLRGVLAGEKGGRGRDKCSVENLSIQKAEKESHLGCDRFERLC